MKKRRRASQRAVDWYNTNEKWLWRATLMSAFMANLYLCSKFVTQEMYWKNYREECGWISQNCRDIEVLKERTAHR